MNIKNRTIAAYLFVTGLYTNGASEASPHTACHPFLYRYLAGDGLISQYLSQAFYHGQWTAGIDDRITAVIRCYILLKKFCHKAMVPPAAIIGTYLDIRTYLAHSVQTDKEICSLCTHVTNYLRGFINGICPVLVSEKGKGRYADTPRDQNDTLAMGKYIKSPAQRTENVNLVIRFQQCDYGSSLTRHSV